MKIAVRQEKPFEVLFVQKSVLKNQDLYLVGFWSNPLSIMIY
jgi:hypothetical protein